MAGFWDFIPALITAGVTLYGVEQASNAGNHAATVMAGAQREGTAAQVAGLEDAKKEIAVNRAAASPGLLATQEVINRGATLTPQQEMAVADSRRLALEGLQGGSLRGSARATSAVLADTDARNRNAFMQQNQQRADTAAQGLSGQYFSAGNTMANADTATGKAVSEGLVNTGDIYGANTIGQGNLRGQAIGDVGAIVADAVKNNIIKDRNSSYKAVY